MNPGWLPEAVLKHWIYLRAAGAQVKNPNMNKVITWRMTWYILNKYRCRRQSVSGIFLSIPSDTELWLSTQIHRTTVTSVTTVIFHPSCPPEAVLKHWMTNTNYVTRNRTHLTNLWRPSLVKSQTAEHAGMQFWPCRTSKRCMAKSRSPLHIYQTGEPPWMLPKMQQHVW